MLATIPPSVQCDFVTSLRRWSRFPFSNRSGLWLALTHRMQWEWYRTTSSGARRGLAESVFRDALLVPDSHVKKSRPSCWRQGPCGTRDNRERGHVENLSVPANSHGKAWSYGGGRTGSVSPVASWTQPHAGALRTPHGAGAGLLSPAWIPSLQNRVQYDGAVLSHECWDHLSYSSR